MGGGFRPGAGRPRGSRDVKPRKRTIRSPGERFQSTPSPVDGGHALKPLDYMLAVMNDPKADPVRRDRMAMAAAPYCHRRAVALGKRKQAEEEATTAGAGTDWGTLLDWPREPLVS